MKISTRGRYGLKAIVDIASGYSCEKCISLKNIAERQGISESYLEQIISPLKKAGLVNSVRGACGGYSLSRAPDEITVGDILRALEGSLAPVDCLHDKAASCGTNDCKLCASKPVFSKLFESANEILDSVTLRDLIDNTERTD